MERRLVRWLNAGPSHPAMGGRLGIAVYEYGDQQGEKWSPWGTTAWIDIVRRYSSGGDSKPDKAIHSIWVDRNVFATTAAMLEKGLNNGG